MSWWEPEDPFQIEPPETARHYVEFRERRAELDEYFVRLRPQLYACPEARRGLMNSMNPPVPGKLAALKVFAPPLVTLSFATLPRWARRMFGAPGLPTTDLSATLAVRALRETTRLLPEPPTPPTLAKARELQLI